MSVHRSTPSLSAYPNPPPGGRMALLHAYFDDSADAKTLTIGGYLSDLKSWARFDAAWTAALGNYPYLHMSEYWDQGGLYKDIKADPETEKMFFKGLIEVIRNCTLFCSQTTVLLEDVARFNKDHRLPLNPYALAIYGCLMALQGQFPRAEIEVTFDRFNHAGTNIDEAKHYFASDVGEPFKPDVFQSIRALKRAETWRTVLPLQAADFLAWEMRKLCADAVPWLSNYDLGEPGRGLASFNKWSKLFAKQSGRAPRDRGSFQELRRANRPRGYIFNYEGLRLLNAIHPHGWRVRKNGHVLVFSGD